MRKEIKHHIFTASSYQHNCGVWEYSIDKCNVYVQKHHVVMYKGIIHANDLPHLFELINQCLKELNNDTK